MRCVSLAQLLGINVLMSRKMCVISTIGALHLKIFDYNGSRNICGRRVLEARRRNSITQFDLAARLQTEGINIERDSISKIESGKRFVADYELLTMAKVLNVSVLWLLDIE